MLKNKTMNLEYINNRISKEICHNTINQLTDNNLLNEYKNCESVKNEINKLTKILEKHNINEDKKDLIINDYLVELIPAGTKGVIRGNKFNHIVKNIIQNIKLDNKLYEVTFEKKCNLFITSEIPDWYIIEKNTNKVIIGMNQLDFWRGGHQINRGYKYLIDNKINKNNIKFLCVICNEIKLRNNRNKIYKLFESGYSNDTLCYIHNLETIIKKFFS